MASAAEHKRVFRRLVEEAYNRGCLAVLDDVLAEDFVYHSSCQPLGGTAEFRERVALMRFALSDLRLCVDDMAAAGDVTWASVTVCGTRRPTPEESAVEECIGFSRIDTCRYADGRIAEYWSESADLM